MLFALIFAQQMSKFVETWSESFGHFYMNLIRWHVRYQLLHVLNSMKSFSKTWQTIWPSKDCLQQNYKSQISKMHCWTQVKLTLNTPNPHQQTSCNQPDLSPYKATWSCWLFNLAWNNLYAYTLYIFICNYKSKRFIVKLSCPMFCVLFNYGIKNNTQNRDFNSW